MELRFDPRDPDPRPRVFLEDQFVCDTVPLDRIRNASRRRRRLSGEPAPDAEPSGLDPLALIEAAYYQRARLVGAAPHVASDSTPKNQKNDSAPKPNQEE